jgi:hypothetical protein
MYTVRIIKRERATRQVSIKFYEFDSLDSATLFCIVEAKLWDNVVDLFKDGKFIQHFTVAQESGE